MEGRIYESHLGTGFIGTVAFVNKDLKDEQLIGWRSGREGGEGQDRKRRGRAGQEKASV